MTKKPSKTGSSKKDLKTTLSAQLHHALADFKEAIHEKKLQKLVKKAAKLLADGLHHNKTTKKPVSKKVAAVKKDAPKKAAKKSILKKAAKKK